MECFIAGLLAGQDYTTISEALKGLNQKHDEASILNLSDEQKTAFYYLFYDAQMKLMFPGDKREREETSSQEMERKRDLKREKKQEDGERDLNAELGDLLKSQGQDASLPSSKKESTPEAGQESLDIVNQQTLVMPSSNILEVAPPAVPQSADQDMAISEDEDDIVQPVAKQPEQKGPMGFVMKSEKELKREGLYQKHLSATDMKGAEISDDEMDDLSLIHI